MRTGVLCKVLTVSAGLSCLGLSAGEKQNAQSQKAVDGLPNISARPVDKENSFGIFADVLVWSAKESGTDNWAQVFSGSGTSESIDLRQVSFHWNVGYRVGFDWGMRHDRWDTQLYYTWFRAKGSDHASTNGEIASSFLGNFYINNPNGEGTGPTYRNACIQWTILFNMFDWDLGRNYWVSRALSLRPFIGLKGGWIDQTVHSKWEDPNVADPEVFGVATENLKNDFWGIGPSFGLDTRWKLGAVCIHSFNLFGDFSGALMWGHWRLKDVYKNDAPQEVAIVLPHISGAASMFRAFMGFGWDATFNKERLNFSLRLGYEAQFWLDQLQFYSFNRGRLANELTLQGGTVDVRFDF